MIRPLSTHGTLRRAGATLVVLLALLVGSARGGKFATSRKNNDTLLQTNNFGIGRGRMDYGQFLTPQKGFERFAHYATLQPIKRGLVNRYLNRLSADDVWIDMGAGSAVAMREYAAAGGKAKMIAIGVKKPGPNDTGAAGLDEALNSSGGRFKYLSGKYVEQYDLHELRGHVGKPATVITDLLGPMTYSDRPDLVLDRYLALLATGGKIFVTLNRATKIAHGDASIGIEAWLRSQPGLELKRVYAPVVGGSGYDSFVIKKTSDHARVTNKLHLESFTSLGASGTPPERVYTVAK